MRSLPFPGDALHTLARAWAAALLAAVVGCSTTSSDDQTVEGMPTPIKTTLSGAGASFPAPLYKLWFQELAQKGVQVNYQSVGSGIGIQQLTYNLVDFAASDVPMKPEERKELRQGVVHIPMTEGAIVVAYNNPGCVLKLSQSQLVGIFQGTITNYSQLGCGAKPIKLVVRSDGSGTTANFTAHLAAIDPVWKQRVGSGKLVEWPVGAKVKGSEGVAAQLNKEDGALGYLEASWAAPPLQSAALTNASGQVVEPTAANKRTALASIDLGPDLTGRNPNPQVGYPLVTFSWILLPKTGNGPTNHAAFNKVFGYTLSQPAQAMAESQGYISLPPAVLEKSRAALASIQP